MAFDKLKGPAGPFFIVAENIPAPYLFLSGQAPYLR